MSKYGARSTAQHSLWDSQQITIAVNEDIDADNADALPGDVLSTQTRLKI